jgi:hypothetical protein
LSSSITSKFKNIANFTKLLIFYLKPKNIIMEINYRKLNKNEMAKLQGGSVAQCNSHMDCLFKNYLVCMFFGLIGMITWATAGCLKP